MMQEINLPAVMRPRELIAQVASYYPSPYDVQAVIKRLGIENIADRPYGKLSGGQKRQAQFAMAIVGRPELLFLDEPTVGLDVHARAGLWQVLRDLLHEGCSIVLTTHYIEEAEALADRVAVITHGRLVASGTVDEVRAHDSRKSILCRTTLPLATLRAWPEVQQVSEDSGRQHIVTRDAEAVLRRLLDADADVSRHRGEACRSRRGVRRDRPRASQTGDAAMNAAHPQMSRSRMLRRLPRRHPLRSREDDPHAGLRNPDPAVPGDVLHAVRRIHGQHARQRANGAVRASPRTACSAPWHPGCSGSASRWPSSANRDCSPSARRFPCRPAPICWRAWPRP